MPIDVRFKECTKFDFRWGPSAAHPRPCSRGTYNAAQLYLKGRTSNRREGRGTEEKGMGKGKEIREGRGRKGKGGRKMEVYRISHLFNPTLTTAKDH